MAYRDTILGTSGLLSYWRLGEASGTAAADEKTVRPGTYQGTFTLGAAGLLTGDTDKALSVAGAGRVNMGTGKIVSGLAAWTIEALIKTTQTAEATLYAERATGNDILRLGINRAGGANLLALVWRDDTGTSQVLLATSGVINDNVAHHVAARYDNGAVKFFVDGAAAGTATATGNTFTNADIVTAIGWDPVVGAFYSGTVDEVAVYNQALSDAQVLAHAQAMQGVFPSGPARHVKLNVAGSAALKAVKLNQGGTAVEHAVKRA